MCSSDLQYTLTPADGGWSVTGPDGNDTLSAIEYAHFSDRSFYLGNPFLASVVTRDAQPLPGVTAHYQDTTVTLSRDAADAMPASGARAITAADALDALKLSVRLDSSLGHSWKELVAADVNRDGRVTAADALEILKMSVGTETIQPSWVFVPEQTATNATTDVLGSMTRESVGFSAGIDRASFDDASAAAITGILLGDVNHSWMIPA